MQEISQYDINRWKRNGILGNGYDGCYGVVESFMRTIIASDTGDPSFAIMFVLDGIKDFDLDTLTYNDFLLSRKVHHNRTLAIERLYVECVELGKFFNGFLQVCENTGLLDPWFLSEEFMSNVHAGSIRGFWSILMSGENSKEPYRERFRKFIKSLDDRGLEWTKKYVEPDPFWGTKKVYW